MKNHPLGGWIIILGKDSMQFTQKKENYLDRIPCRKQALQWDKDGDIVTLHVKHRGFFAMIAQKCFNRPRVTHLDLDDFGSFLWASMDGNKTVGELADALKSQFGEDVEPLYNRLVSFLQLLYQNDFIYWRK